MNFDEWLFVLLVIGVYTLVGLAVWGCHRLHLFGYAPSAQQVEALTDAVSEHVAATKVNNAIAPGLFKQLEEMVHKLTTHAAAPAPATPAAPDPHPAGAVATPSIPVVMPSTAQPHVDAVHAMPEPPWMAELREMKMSMQGMQPAPLVPGGSVTVTVGTGGVGGPASAPEPVAQPMTLQNEPAATVPAQAPAVAA